MVQKVYKYVTGAVIPENAIYRGTVTQTKIYDERSESWKDCWLVWHYFSVEVKE